MSRAPIDVAVVGADDALGETVLELLSERGFPAGRVHVLSAARDVDGTAEYAGGAIDLESVHAFDFSGVKLAFFCASGTIAAEYAPRAVDAGARVIDASPRFRLDDDVPLLVPQVNANLARAEAPLWAVPAAATVPLALVSSPLDAAFGIDAIGAVALYPVSASGSAGIRELAEQTRALFNQQSASPQFYPKQIAFNVFPLVDALDESGASREETAIAAELARILEAPALATGITCLRVPVFYGMGIAATLTTREPAAVAEVRECLAEAPGVRVMDDPDALDFPAPATDAVNQDEALVGRIRRSHGDDRTLDLWLASDNLRLGQALPAVQLAELLVEKYLS
ncbi:MAG TPA: aspartate-semialdehyde dehydrogenase [Pelomicrobium sp.]|nr:aspartate-semialdehyde dehydrogenase [Pelomicrobium sp.]